MSAPPASRPWGTGFDPSPQFLYLCMLAALENAAAPEEQVVLNFTREHLHMGLVQP